MRITRFIEQILQTAAGRKRILYTLGVLAVYRIGQVVPIPGIHPEALRSLLQAHSHTAGGFVGLFSGGALEKFSVLSLGLGPYMAAAGILYILQLLGILRYPRGLLEGEAEHWRNRSLVLATPLALVQSYGLAHAIAMTPTPGGVPVVSLPPSSFYPLAILSLTSGAILAAWLAQQITERGIGNGISVLILAGIADGVPRAIQNFIQLVRQGALENPMLPLGAMLGIFILTVWMEQAQVQIPILPVTQGPESPAGKGTSGFFSFNISQAGPTAIGWAVGVLSIPVLVAQFDPVSDWSQKWLRLWDPGQGLYETLLACLILFFCYFFTAIHIRSKTLANAERVLDRVVWVGGLFVALVAMVPDLLRVVFSIPFYFGGTALLLSVGLALDIVRHLEAHGAEVHENFNTVFTGFNVMEANLAKGLLEARGIQTFLLDENISRLSPLMALAFGGVRVVVSKTQAKEARALLEERLPSLREDRSAGAGTAEKGSKGAEASDPASRACPGCGVPCDLDAAYCDQCGRRL